MSNDCHRIANGFFTDFFVVGLLVGGCLFLRCLPESYLHSFSGLSGSWSIFMEAFPRLSGSWSIFTETFLRCAGSWSIFVEWHLS